MSFAAAFSMQPWLFQSAFSLSSRHWNPAPRAALKREVLAAGWGGPHILQLLQSYKARLHWKHLKVRLIDARDQWLGLEIIRNRCSSLCMDSWNQQDLWKMTSTWMSESYKSACGLLVRVVFVTQFTVVRTWCWLAVLRGSVGLELLWHCIAFTHHHYFCVHQTVKGVFSSKESVLWVQALRIRNNCMLLLEARTVARTDEKEYGAFCRWWG